MIRMMGRDFPNVRTENSSWSKHLERLRNGVSSLSGRKENFLREKTANSLISLTKKSYTVEISTRYNDYFY